MKNYLFLLLAIVFETIATSSLKASEQFTKLVPSLITIIGYIAAFYLLSLTLRSIPVGIAYAIWSGIGIVLVTLVGIVMFKQVPDLPAIIGLLLIIAGVVVINVFSKTSAH
ncbi:small multidrug resistance pump [Flavobacterium gossypii]|uniref:Small multidrug resistance pump n=2 Tax=Flavobacterium TaxID=237 RepID=A0A495M1S4_9FLAO|nr:MULTISPECIES: SMR family transporter [Flavobacterium]MBA9074321.1 small multidrug resistance pump [Flavobacterium gossypii]RKS19080.1 small multidrug resistance pump [Flavobacterium endophyticum]WDO11574.1 SMR family transporter [Flavobacterium sp. WW92]